MAEKSVALFLARSLNSVPEAQNIMRARFGVFSLQHPWAISVALLLGRIMTRASIDFFAAAVDFHSLRCKCWAKCLAFYFANCGARAENYRPVTMAHTRNVNNVVCNISELPEQ
jgi:hypothetical protein